MKKILIIIRREFLTRIQKRSFILLTILMPFIFAVLIFLPIWLSSVQGDEVRTVMLVDKTGRYGAALSGSHNYNFVPVAENKDEFYAEDSDVTAVLCIDGELHRDPTAVVLYSSGEVPADLLTFTNAALNEQVRKDKLQSHNIPELENIIKDVESTLSVPTIKRNMAGDESASSTDVAMFAGYMFTILIYIFVMAYGGMVMQSVIEEKSGRILELMVSSVKPFQLMMGKIIGVALVGFVQLAIWGMMLALIIASAGALFGLDTGAVATPTVAGGAVMPSPETLDGSNELLSAITGLPFLEMGVMFVLYFIGGYLLYASFFAAVGASINSQEDSSQFMTPVILIILFGFYAAMFSMENTNGPLAFWTSVFPLTSPIVMMIRVPFGVPLWQEVLSLLLLYGTALLFIYIGAKIYRVGILMYGKKPSIREMLKWVRYK